MGNVAKISPRVPSTFAHNAILYLLIIHIIPSGQIHEAIDNPSLIPSVSCVTSISYLLTYVRAANDVSHAENVQTDGWLGFSHLNQSRDGIQVTQVFRYCGEHQG